MWGRTEIDEYWKSFTENVLVLGITDAIKAYVFTMTELIANTIQYDIKSINASEETFRSLGVNLKLFIVALFSLLGIVITFYVVKWFFRIMVWIFWGRDVNGNDITYYNEPTRKPMCQNRISSKSPESARWLKQALHDLRSARNDFDGDTIATEWVCYKCHQAFEKGLKAYIIYHFCPSDMPNISTHDLCELALLTSNGQLMTYAQNIQGLVGATPRMRYPDFLPFPKTPSDVFSLQDAVTVHELTETALDYIQYELKNKL